MSKYHARCGPRWPRIGRWIDGFLRPLSRGWHARHHVYDQESLFAKNRLQELRDKLALGETVYLAGIGPFGHNAGAALIQVSRQNGIRLICNDEEERYRGVKHYGRFPYYSVYYLRDRCAELGIEPKDVFAWLGAWNYPAITPLAWRTFFEEFPFSWRLLDKRSMPNWDFRRCDAGVQHAPSCIARTLELPDPQPIISLPHHDNHAAGAIALSPFNQSRDPVMITVLDGFGDEGAISLYTFDNGQLKVLQKNHSIGDSLGAFYSVISSAIGGWTTLSSEGRFMGAAAWGDDDRLTNPFYKQLRQIFHFAPEGQIFVNRSLANWHATGELEPFTDALEGLLGAPVPCDKLWNPDHILRVEDVKHSPITQKRVDIAAATQLVFEDAVFHIVDHLIRTTGSDKLVMTGGTALNCLANMKLLDRFDRGWYQRHLAKDTRLHLWVPPVPGDPGTPLGAAVNFALQAGANPGEPIGHAFYCGSPPATSDIVSTISEDIEIESLPFGNVKNEEDLLALTDLMAYLVSRDGVVGIFQGAAETGPRALGHRSILANPCNPETLKNINELVKFREPIRPLAPMVTLEAAQEFFELSDGASDADCNAYNYMVLTVMAKPNAHWHIPAVIHKDGTARIQIVRKKHDPVCYGYLQAMGRHVGAEVSVNTSLNVGSPIVQSPVQALSALKKAKAMTGLVMIGADGDVFLIWHNVVNEAKDGGQQFMQWIDEWRQDFSSKNAALEVQSVRLD